jgi:hypothetical protein
MKQDPRWNAEQLPGRYVRWTNASFGELAWIWGKGHVGFRKFTQDAPLIKPAL